MDAIQLTAGMRANLLSLQKTERLMETTQSRLATGLRIQSALDDPINYFAAKGHRDRAGDLAFRKEEMMEGIERKQKSKVLSISNRKVAIKAAYLLAEPGDIILVAGKGHEKYQEIKGVKYPFDDKTILEELLKPSINQN